MIPEHTPIDLVGGRVAIPKTVYEALLARDKQLEKLLYRLEGK